ncbi:hypothetical protein C8F04DRAFT_1244573 [Mycena alexandri]|uniref:Uncharacterized protein n=1 Tax=Mycena alexandri TaxID=1745969 RepID=A0AAD6RX45_9AGAR|nr:hypothetical protein C8F04DRAFT_1244573 [Mycena alexandri]
MIWTQLSGGKHERIRMYGWTSPSRYHTQNSPSFMQRRAGKGAGAKEIQNWGFNSGRSLFTKTDKSPMRAGRGNTSRNSGALQRRPSRVRLRREVRAGWRFLVEEESTALHPGDEPEVKDDKGTRVSGGRFAGESQGPIMIEGTWRIRTRQTQANKAKSNNIAERGRRRGGHSGLATGRNPPRAARAELTGVRYEPFSNQLSA